MTTPNIFSYATKELSQDAFICWLIACAIKATGNLRACGLEFVRALFRAGALDGTEGVPVLGPDGESIAPHDGPCDVSDVCTPRLQHQKIDVYFQAKVDGKKVSFLIEDKINTRDHSNQLERYLDSISQDEEKEDLIKPVYFKTGYVFSDERCTVKKNKYFVFEAEDLKNFLDCHPDAIRENEILHQYSEYLNDKIKKRAEALANWDLNQDYVQWEFMLKLRYALKDAVGEWKHFVPHELSDFQDEWTWKGLGRGKNVGGSAWTQYWFSKHLYWRLDSWKPLRLMISLGNAGESYDVVHEYRNRFNEARQQEGLCAGKVQMRRGNECTVGSIETANETANLQGMMVSEFLDRVTRVHIRFLERMQQSV